MTAITKTDAGVNLQRDGQSGANNPKIKYVAFGTDNTPPTSAQTQLVAEVFRKAVTSTTAGGTGEILINLYLSPTDLTGINIQEIGFFGGSAASITANTGVLIARGLYSHTKLNSESITFVLDSTIS